MICYRDKTYNKYMSELTIKDYEGERYFGMEIARILPDGGLQFRIGHWKGRKTRDQKLQAYINQQEIYGKDVRKQ